MKPLNILLFEAFLHENKCIFNEQALDKSQLGDTVREKEQGLDAPGMFYRTIFRKFTVEVTEFVCQMG